MPTSDPGFQPNPYQTPAHAGEVLGDQQGGHLGSARVVMLLRQTRPWVRFLSILGFITAGLMLIFGVIGPAVAATTATVQEGLVLLAYLPLGILYIVPSIYLHRYAKHIRTLEYSGQLQALEDALQAQKSFWRFVGICMAILICLYVAGLVVVLLFVSFTAAIG